MTSIPVKDVGSVFMNSSKVQGTGGVSATGDFQAIWNAQTEKGAGNDVRQNNVSSKTEIRKVNDAQKDLSEETAVKPEEPGEAKTADKAEKTVAETVSEQPEEMTEEEMKAAMEVLGTAAVAMMQKIADVFGISMEELQAAMDALGMGQTEVLDASKLSGLLLQLGGAADTYALVTDETLYNNYRELMNQLNGILTECAEDLKLDAEQLNQLVQQAEEQPAAQEVIVPEEQMMQAVEEVPDATEATETDDHVPEVVLTEETVVGEADAENVDSGDNTGSSRDGKQNAEEGVAEQVDGNAAHRGNEFSVQNIRTESFANQIQQATGTYAESPWDTQTLDIMRQIMDHMKVQVNAETQTLEMQLHPASLGTLQVNVASKGGVITASFVTENEAVKAALESQMIQLKESFAEQGVKVEAIEVTVQTHEFERNLDQGRGRNDQEAPKRNRTRRINLNDALSMDEMEEEDAVAAEMMAASGSTVDYTV